ncbi:MAG: 4-alpha-glucanotransferase, partial [Desulfovibrionaceae bacterium]|nr:4-alpha-glucanotransferase [Desulfovibrionaceae bacterium]
MRERSCGVLLHISSLPTPFGIGDLGPAARSFASGLAAAGVSYWQMLPLTQTEVFLGNSPYSSPSAFAGNPLFISPELLLEEGWISPADLDDSLSHAGMKRERADYAGAGVQRRAILHAAYERCADLEKQEDFAFFCRTEAGWLDDYALFVSIKEERTGESWVDWPEKLKGRDPDALKTWELGHRRSVLRHKFIQYLFFSQWRSLRRHCHLTGLDLIGDLPIYVTHDSSDVWANQNLFQLDEEGRPLKVAGVPPDYFSATGQRWGNPVY